METLHFDWDQWNVQKNEIKHGISSLEAESVFFDPDLVIFRDIQHSRGEQRFVLYGLSKYHHILMVAFTLREKKVRIISARTASKKERGLYENKRS